MNIPHLDLKKLNAPYAEEMKRAAAEVIDSGWFLNGKRVAEFERQMSEMHGGAECVAVSNGLDAIRLIASAYIKTGRLQPGDEVIVPANTYIASLIGLTEMGLTAVPAEPDPTTLNLDTTRLSEYLTPRTRAVMAVHLYGNPCWDRQLMDFATANNLLIIEDNAQAIGALAAEEGFHGSRATGALGDAAAFSFYPTKNIGALGDAGAVATSDTALSDTIKALANYGSDRRYHNIYRGYNCRMDEIQAAMLRVKLRHLDEETGRRAAIAGVYDSTISNPLVEKPAIFPAMRQVWHQYVVRLPEGLRDRFRTYLAEKGIGTDVHYPDPPYLQPCYSEYADLAQPDRPSIVMSRTCVSLPIANVSPSEALEVSRVINTFQTP